MALAISEMVNLTDTQMDWFDRECEALERQLANGEISQSEFHREMAELRRDAKEQDDREAIIDAGRGHLLRDH